MKECTLGHQSQPVTTSSPVQATLTILMRHRLYKAEHGQLCPTSAFSAGQACPEAWRPPAQESTCRGWSPIFKSLQPTNPLAYNIVYMRRIAFIWPCSAAQVGLVSAHFNWRHVGILLSSGGAAGRRARATDKFRPGVVNLNSVIILLRQSRRPPPGNVTAARQR